MSKDLISPKEVKVKKAVDRGKGVVGLEFDSEVLVNQAPTLELTNGKIATFITQYDSKTLLFKVDKGAIGQKITGLASGRIESIHNLPVNLTGASIPGGVNGDKGTVNEVPEYKEKKSTKKPATEKKQANKVLTNHHNLPSTGSTTNVSVLFLGIATIILGLLTMINKRKQ